MEKCSHLVDFDRLYEDINELRECKNEIASLKEYRMGSDEKFKEIKENVSRIFDRIEGSGDKGIRGEIADVRNLLTKFDENITEVYERIEKIEILLEKTIKEVYELTPIVKALMDVETERRQEKASFRREFRLWVIGFIATIILTAVVNWVNISSSKNNNETEMKTVVSKHIHEDLKKDSIIEKYLTQDSSNKEFLKIYKEIK